MILKSYSFSPAGGTLTLKFTGADQHAALAGVVGRAADLAHVAQEPGDAELSYQRAKLALRAAREALAARQQDLPPAKDRLAATMADHRAGDDEVASAVSVVADAEAGVASLKRRVEALERALPTLRGKAEVERLYHGRDAKADRLRDLEARRDELSAPLAEKILPNLPELLAHVKAIHDLSN